MDTIKIYIDNLFDGLPQNEEVLQIKNDLLLNMEDKMLELMKEGKTENEAIGTVIGEFGNIDELKESFGISVTAQDFNETGNELKIKWSVADVQAFLDNRKKATSLIAIGVVLCMMAGATLIALSEINDGTVGLVILLLLVAIAVGIFIYANSFNQIKEFNAQEMYISNEAKQYLSVYEKGQKRRSVFPTALGVIICILSSLFVIVPNDALRESMQNVFVALTISSVAIAAFLFITFNDYKTGIDMLLERESFSPQEKKAEKVVGTVAAVWWMSVVALYLGYSFITGNWGMSWIIWPVAGVLFGAIAVLTTALVKE